MRGVPSLAFALAVAGCATQNNALEEELSRLRREVRTLNQKISENDLELERLEGRVTLLALGQSGEVAPSPKTPAVGASEPAAKKPAKVEQPKRIEQPKINQLTGPQRSLPVVKLGTDDEGSFETGAIDDGSPPILIKLTGPPEDELPVDREVLKRPDPVLDAPKPVKREAEPDEAPRKRVTKAEVKAAYEIALAKLRIDGNPAAARKLFERFQRRYPTSEYLDNVAYWSAECDFAEERHREAAEAFQKMIDAFPRSPKVPHARLRKAEALRALGKNDQAEVLLEKVIAEHPGSDAAKKAEALLERAGGRR
jgi:tol-pal system protein YbgF